MGLFDLCLRSEEHARLAVVIGEQVGPDPKLAASIVALVVEGHAGEASVRAFSRARGLTHII